MMRRGARTIQSVDRPIGPTSTAAAFSTMRATSTARAITTAVATGLLLVGCSHPAQPTLTGPSTDLTVTIPDGWHQVVNAANPVIPEMVSPATCRGAAEVSCALGLARTATFPAESSEQAADVVRESVLDDSRLTEVTDVSKGPGKIGELDGYRYRFTFRNPQAKLTCEIAALPSGSATPDANGHRPFSVILVWMSDKPGAPKVDDIDEIVGSARLTTAAAPK
jgi:hypothetical protein